MEWDTLDRDMYRRGFSDAMALVISITFSIMCIWAAIYFAANSYG